MLRDHRIDELNQELGHGRAPSREGFRFSSKVDDETDQALHKDLFSESQKKQEFYEVAKQLMTQSTLEHSDVTHALSYMRFYQKCQKSGTLALPIFSKASNQILSVVG